MDEDTKVTYQWDSEEEPDAPQIGADAEETTDEGDDPAARAAETADEEIEAPELKSPENEATAHRSGDAPRPSSAAPAPPPEAAAARSERIFHLPPVLSAVEDEPEEETPEAVSASAPIPFARPAAPQSAPRSAEAPVTSPAAAPHLIDEHDVPFELAGAQKLGIVGGKMAGKSYLFQAMVYRTTAGVKSGALTYYLEGGGIRLFSALQHQGRADTLNLVRFTRRYERWERLPQTILINQLWYRLQLPYRTGLLGTGRGALEVEYFDGSGEGFFEVGFSRENQEQWRVGYSDARVMVFCLPLWAAFPGRSMTEEDWRRRDELLEGFEQVVQNYTSLWEKFGHPVRTILALTMADDPRGALTALRESWITPYLDQDHRYLRRLRKGSGIARYLASARRVSEALRAEFESARDPHVAGIPQKLSFRAGAPWLIPVSAVEGRMLDSIESRYPDPDARPRLDPPVPAHVELPLLVALCERENALM